MKPRTKIQRDVMCRSARLDSLRYVEKKWAIQECLDRKGFATKTRVICMECGNRFAPVLDAKTTCPHCGSIITIEKTAKRTDTQRVYFATAEVHGDYQVIRNYELDASYREGMIAQISCREVLQHWILPDGTREVVARTHISSWYSDLFSGSPLEIRNKSERRKYDVYPDKISPYADFQAQYRLVGIDHALQGLTPLDAIEVIPKTPMAETLLKAKQWRLLSSFGFDGISSNVYRYWKSIKICMRNNYFISDASMWFDYLNMLTFFGKDLNNAHYVCPVDLHEAHDRYLKKKRAFEAKREQERKRAEAIENEAAYKEFIAGFSGVSITDGEIEIRPLSSVNEFMEEGDELHHCVFLNGYYKRTGSLILSAKFSDGKRLETIEFDLKQQKVVQCRGLQNHPTKYHDRIVSLVNRNKKKILKRVNAEIA